ncbi:MAG: hypothetical protein C4B59_03725 [Candidatus Methanogaster sp.]|uniref:Uncharacterized protein n=1 Tax=Candidatus Methanogaster sp. TaxID=3386292 RepID=A0AC61L4I0_9EURY|nr:MAG: hypothetical protein C4B59_03725 [ANME-2 cluster archaeon]
MVRPIRGMRNRLWHLSFVPLSANPRSRSLHHVITTIPLFALTEVGKERVIEQAKEIETPVLPEQKQPAGWRSQVKSI